MVSGIGGVMAMDSETDVAFAVAAGYRFNRAFGLGIEVTMAPSLGRDLSRPYPYPLRTGFPIDDDDDDSDGQVTIFTTNVRLEVPTTSRRIVPYAVAGGGVANIKESLEVIILPAVQSFTFTARETMIPTIYPPIYPYPQPYVVSSTSLALALGAGVSVLATERLSIDLDLRAIRILAERDRNIGRFGIGASYRF